MASGVSVSPSNDEMQARVAHVRRKMVEADYAALIVFANVQFGNAGPVRYLSGYHQPTRREFLVLPAEQAPVLLLPNPIQQRVAKATSWLKDIRQADSLTKEVVDFIGALNLSPHARIGVVGLEDKMSVSIERELRRGLVDFELIDASRFYEAVRMVKSAEEISMTRDTARIADLCLDVVKGTLRAGVSERDVVSEAYRVLMREGVEDVLLLSTKGRSMSSFIGMPNDYVFSPGDSYTFSLEISGPSGYWTQVARCFSIGAQPDARHQVLHRTAETVIAAGVERLRPGSNVTDIAIRMRETASKLGYRTAHWGGHGMGLDIGEPPGISVDSEVVIQEGMVITIHPALFDPQVNDGIFLGDTYVITADGAQNLSSRPRELFLAG